MSMPCVTKVRDASNVSANSLDHAYQTGDYVNTCMDSINAVATNYSSLFTACSNVFLCSTL